ncbi:MAG TPA: hypothetical protein VJB02_03755 [Coxiellaceae bacterium]|nr:hypothetical protein [Coxiellaceae bacterium]
MTRIAREDGIQFILQPYRETITAAKKQLILQKLQLLSNQHGPFVRLFKRTVNTIEAVFALEPGYLAGETIYRALRKQFEPTLGSLENIIYCEMLPASHEVLVVVVQNGSVYLDANIPADVFQLQEELTAFLVTGQAYHVFVVGGDIPLTDKAVDGKMCLPAQTVASFNRVVESILTGLSKETGCEVMPMGAALKAAHLDQNHTFVYGAVFFLVLLIFMGWWLWERSDSAASAVATQTTTVESPYLAYNRAMMTPAPYQQLSELAEKLETLYFAPGWEVNKLWFDGSNYKVVLQQKNGTVQALRTWAEQNGVRFELQNQTAEVSLPSYLLARKKPQDVYSLQQVETLLIDQLETLTPSKDVFVGKRVMHGPVQAVELSIHLQKASTQALKIIAKELKDLPVSLTMVSLKMENGLLSGEIKLSVWGN